MGGPPISRNITGVQRLVSNVSEAESRVTSGELEDYRWKPVGAGRLFGIKDSNLMSYLVESNVQILHIPAPVMGRKGVRVTRGRGRPRIGESGIEGVCLIL